MNNIDTNEKARAAALNDADNADEFKYIASEDNQLLIDLDSEEDYIII